MIPPRHEDNGEEEESLVCEAPGGENTGSPSQSAEP